jgi:hypothetical protein
MSLAMASVSARIGALLSKIRSCQAARLPARCPFSFGMYDGSAAT